VRERIAAACARVGRDPTGVTLVAVTKGRSPDELRALVDAGQHALAENRVQAWRDASAVLEGREVAWHLIGHLQRNKVRFCRPFELIHSLDSLRLAEALDAEGARHEHRFDVLVQVNVSGEESKYGVDPAALPALLEQLARLPFVRVRGLMTMAPYDDDPERARPHFRALRELGGRFALHELSMGMSGDFEVAIEEGATLVRIGSALFTPPGAT
jgi:PLP dependent protein